MIIYYELMRQARDDNRHEHDRNMGDLQLLEIEFMQAFGYSALADPPRK